MSSDTIISCVKWLESGYASAIPKNVEICAD